MKWSPIGGLALAVSMCLANRATGQEEDYGPDRGDWLLGASGNYRYSHADANSGGTDEVETFSARLSGGWYQNRTHEYGFELLPNLTRLENSPDTSDVYLGAYYNYNHWASPRTTLYGGPQLGLAYIDGSDSETAFAYGLHAGVRYWINTAVSINLEPRWTIADLDDDLGGQTSNVDIFFGISFKL